MKTFRCLRQQPRQRHFDAQRVFEHFNARRRSLAERAHTETQRVSFPSLLLNRDHRSEITVGAGEALFDTANRLAFSKAMADGDCDGFAHGGCNLITWTCMRAILIDGDRGSRSARIPWRSGALFAVDWEKMDTRCQRNEPCDGA